MGLGTALNLLSFPIIQRYLERLMRVATKCDIAFERLQRSKTYNLLFLLGLPGTYFLLQFYRAYSRQQGYNLQHISLKQYQKGVIGLWQKH